MWFCIVSGYAVLPDLIPSWLQMPNRIMVSSAVLRTSNSRSFGRTRFGYWQQPSDCPTLASSSDRDYKLEASAFGFCLSMHFDECADAALSHS